MNNTDRPNILHLFTDQQRFDTIGAVNNPVIRTPNLDRLVSDGVTFTSAYSPCPVCIAARCSMHYGQYPASTDCLENTPMPTDDRQSFVGALTEADYRTHSIGKRHFMPDRNAGRGFETIESQEEGIPSPDKDDYVKWLFDQGYSHIVDPHGMRGEMYYIPQPAQMPAELHPTQWIGNRSVAFIEEQAGNEQPWMLFSSYIHPHPPFSPPAPWYKLYRAPHMPEPRMPRDIEAQWSFINRHQNRYKYRDQGIDYNLLRNQKAFYYACISFVDYQVGRILDALEKTGQLDNTLIIYTADHGEYMGDYHCFGKRGVHDSCMRIPMITRLPGRLAGGQRCDTPVSLVDIAPTALAAAGTNIGTHELDGVDLAEVAADNVDRDAVFSHYERFDRAIVTAITRDYKYARSQGDGKDFLYDRRTDPLELRNCAYQPFREKDAEAVAELAKDSIRGTAFGERTLSGDTWRDCELYELPPDPDAGLLIQDPRWADTFLPGYSE